MNPRSDSDGMRDGSGPGISRAESEPGPREGVVSEAVERMCAEAVSSIVFVCGFGLGTELTTPLGTEGEGDWWVEEI